MKLPIRPKTIVRVIFLLIVMVILVWALVKTAPRSSSRPYEGLFVERRGDDGSIFLFETALLLGAEEINKERKKPEYTRLSVARVLREFTRWHDVEIDYFQVVTASIGGCPCGIRIYPARPHEFETL